MENSTFEVSLTAFLSEKEGQPGEGEMLGEFASVEDLNEFLAGAHLNEKHPGKVVNLDVRGHFIGGYDTRIHCLKLADCCSVSPEDQDFIRYLYSTEGMDHFMNDNLEVDYIPYHLILEVTSLDDKTIHKGESPNFFRINEFILSTKDMPEYKNAIATIWPAEVVGDISEDESWGQNLKEYDYISDDVAKDIENSILEEIEGWERTGRNTDSPIRPDLYTEPDDYLKKKAMRSEFTYICPECLYEIDDCRCEHYPWTAIQIDTILLPVIRELNLKGYRTAYCCSGHQPGDQIHVVFQHDYCPPHIPDGFYYSYSGFNLFRPCPEKCSDEEYYRFRLESADALLKWAESLPENHWPDGV